MPYAGQNEPHVATLTEEVAEIEAAEVKSVAAVNPARNRVERKTFSQPTGNLLSTNIGIKSTLNPTNKNGDGDLDLLEEERNETYTADEFDIYWREYALAVKREKRDSLYATLINCKVKINSQHQILITIQNSVQGNEITQEKGELLRFLREKLKNSHINLNFEITESEAIPLQDSKSTFNRLAEENSSLNKFRKLFNLDIDY